MNEKQHWCAMGLFLLVVTIAAVIFRPDSDTAFAFVVLSIVSIAIRIWVAKMVSNFAAKQHRNSISWYLFAMLSPSLCLITFGLVKPKFA